MFRTCVDSLMAMQVPDGVRLVFLFVENDKALTIGPIADGLRAAMGPKHAVEALLEPTPGIPLARNRALDRANALDCDWLIFIDDDETVDPDWLLAHMRAAREQGFDLAAGPVEQHAPDGPLSDEQKAVFAYLTAEARRRRRIREGRLASDEAARNDIATNNWIGRLARFRESGLRFDEAMQFTGGSDTDLSRRAKAAGFRIGWVTDAVVRETIPADRLTEAYVFDRARSQTLAKYHIRYRKAGRAPVLKPVWMAATKGLVGTLRILLGRLTGNPTLRIKGARTKGIAAGWLHALKGRQSDLYRSVQGH
jgi:glycosyltransferase involved in cell wall biosynthesis